MQQRMGWQSITCEQCDRVNSQSTHNGDAVIVDVSNIVQFFFDLGMLSLGPVISMGQLIA